MRSSRARVLLYGALLLLFILRHDLWLWRDARFVWGLPVGLTYHVAYCVVVAGVMALLIRHAGPETFGEDDGDGIER